jgi:hypothetical protein
MSQAELLELYRNIVDFSYTNVAKVVAHRRKLTPTETQELIDAMLYRATSTPREERKQYLIGMTEMSIRYTDKRTRLFNNKIQIARTAAADARKDARKVDDSK